MGAHNVMNVQIVTFVTSIVTYLRVLLVHGRTQGGGGGGSMGSNDPPSPKRGHFHHWNFFSQIAY